MRSYVNIDCKKLEKNIRVIKNLCDKHGIFIVGVIKAVGGSEKVAEILINCGVNRIANSRIDDIKKISNLDCEKWLIRMPSESEIEETVKFADVSLNSEIKTIKSLNKEALKQGKKHKVIIMVDLGDLREGFIDETEMKECIDYVKKADGLEMYGIGTNLTCFSFVLPDIDKMNKIEKLSQKYMTGNIISAGNSATMNLMIKGSLPSNINCLRLGESILFGRERENFSYISGTYNDAFILTTEIIEKKKKPSLPWGKIGCNSYGVRPQFNDEGERIQLICCVGREDIDPETMWPIDSNIKILGASSDHLILEVMKDTGIYEVGMNVKFRLGYFATMRAFTSNYIDKYYI